MPRPATELPTPGSPREGGLLRRLLAILPGFCSYCGRRYRPYPSVTAFQPPTPLPASGRACPEGHEGYTDRMDVVGFLLRVPFDNVSPGDNGRPP